MSPSLRGRGLKSNIVSAIHVVQAVALFARAWIEIACMKWQCHGVYVALFARAWIEIQTQISLPVICVVALFARAWIEILML